MESKSENPWREGFWYSKQQPNNISIIKGNEMKIKSLVALDYPEEDVKDFMSGTWTLGDFGETSKELREATGYEKCNVEMNISGMKFPGVLDESGTKFSAWGFTNSLEITEWMPEEALEKLREDREPFDAPSCDYIKNPGGKPGKMYWLSGPPGAGKSTTAQLFARKKGFVYFEADCCMVFANPFVDPNVDNPSIAGFKQKPLKGVPKDMLDAFQTSTELFNMLQTGEFKDVDEKFMPLVTNMAKMIKQQRTRLGGDWSIAQAIPSRHLRNVLRKLLGPDLVFVVLNLTKDCQKKRITNRHGTASEELITMMNNFYDLYEPAGDDEENAVNIEITDEMTPDDVLEKVIQAVQ